MARLQLPRATSTVISTYAPNEGEIFYDITNDEVKADAAGVVAGKALAWKDGSNLTASSSLVTATGGTTARTLADLFAQQVWAIAYGVVAGSSSDQSANMQLALDAAAGKTLILPDADIYCKALKIPHQGVKIVGTPAAYSVTALGTRLILPNASNAYILASDGYVDNDAFSNYGFDLDGVTLEGNKANQSSAAPLLIIRASRTWLRRSVTIANSKGQGVLVTAKSANNTATNSMPEILIQAKINGCDEEGIYGADDSGNHFADLYVIDAILGDNGGGSTKKHNVYIERGAGVIVTNSVFYGVGKGELYVALAGRTVITGNHFDETSAGQTSGTVNTLEVVCGGTGAHAHVTIANNIFHSSKASAGSVTWQHLSIVGGGANSIVSLGGNTFYSHSFAMAGWVQSGTVTVRDAGSNAYYQCTKPITALGNLANTALYTGLLSGMTMANNAGDATNDIDFAAGYCVNSTGVAVIQCSALTKQLDVNWAVGNNAGGLDTGAIADAVYHCYAIAKDSDSSGDFLFSQSVSAPTMPTGYTYFRRIGSIIRSGGAIRAFTQNGDEFLLTVPSNPVATNNPGTSAVTVTPGTIPSGVKVNAILDWGLLDTTPAAATYMLVTSPDQTDSTPSVSMFTLATAAAGAAVPTRANIRTYTRTNTSRQVRYRIDASSADITVYLMVAGWVDTRGRI